MNGLRRRVQLMIIKYNLITLMNLFVFTKRERLISENL